MPCKSIPVRYVLTLLGVMGFFSLYSMRVTLSIALVAMVGTSQQSSENVTCPELLGNITYSNSTTAADGEFDWTTKEQGYILGSFYYGYIVTQLPGGIIAQKYGAKWVFGFGILMTALSTLMIPVAAQWNYWALIAVRIVAGFGDGVTFPAINNLIGRWSTKMERSRMSSLMFTGGAAGSVVGLVTSGILCDSPELGGWRSVFYVFGTLGCLWFAPWFLLVHETPSEHPRISKEELEHILEGQKEEKIVKNPTPWKCILTSVPVWGLVITHFGFAWGFFTLALEIPTYMAQVLHYQMQEIGWLASLPNLMSIIFSVISSMLADRIRRTGRVSINIIRKVFNSIGFFGTAACLLGVAFSDCNSQLIVFLITFSMCFGGFIYSGFSVTHVDMSPDYAGALFGLTNFFASFAGVILPNYVSWVVQDGQTVQNWSIVFITYASVRTITGLVYLIFCTAGLQPWGKSSDSQPANNIASEKIKNDIEVQLEIPPSYRKY